MSAFVISEVRGRDAGLLDRYRELAARSIARHGGRYIVRGERPLAAEGTWDDRDRMVVVEFPDMASLRAWYASPDYARALAIRPDALERRLLFVDGLVD